MQRRGQGCPNIKKLSHHHLHHQYFHHLLYHHQHYHYCDPPPHTHTHLTTHLTITAPHYHHHHYHNPTTTNCTYTHHHHHYHRHCRGFDKFLVKTRSPDKRVLVTLPHTSIVSTLYHCIVKKRSNYNKQKMNAMGTITSILLGTVLFGLKGNRTQFAKQDSYMRQKVVCIQGDETELLCWFIFRIALLRLKIGPCGDFMKMAKFNDCNHTGV